MISGKIPKNEAARLLKLQALDILDTLEEEAYDDLTFLAATICETPISLVSLVDQSRQWFKSHHGLEATETPREYALCGHAINQDEILYVEDTTIDPRFQDNPIVTNAPNVRFYAGAPLILENDIRVGTLCVIDNEPRTLSEKQKASLVALSRQVVAQLNLRLKIKQMSALDKAKDEFLAVVSHEMRTPVTSLYGSLKIIQHESMKFDESIRPMVDIAARNSDHLLKLVNDILDLSTMEAGALKVSKSEINLVTIAKNSLELNQAYTNEFHCTTELIYPEEMSSILVNADEHRLLQAMTNLISNAAKFSKENGKIIIELKPYDSTVEFSITDFGSGIPIDEQEKLFEKFNQLGFEQNLKQPGTGLGLVITKHILEAHDSTIEFESIPNKKTRFFFKLPLIQ